jgi:hypothetical protein
VGRIVRRLPSQEVLQRKVNLVHLAEVASRRNPLTVSPELHDEMVLAVDQCWICDRVLPGDAMYRVVKIGRCWVRGHRNCLDWVRNMRVSLGVDMEREGWAR